MTPRTEGRISSVCSWGDFVFAGAGQSIFAYRKGKIVFLGYDCFFCVDILARNGQSGTRRARGFC